MSEGRERNNHTINAEKLENMITAEWRSRDDFIRQLEQRKTYIEDALDAYAQDPLKEQTLAEHEHVFRYTLQEYQEEIAANQSYSPKYEEYVRTSGQRNLEIDAVIGQEIEKFKENEKERMNRVLTEILAEIEEKDLTKAEVLNILLEKERVQRTIYDIERQKRTDYLRALENVPSREEGEAPQYTRDEYLAEIQANHGYSPKYLEDLRRTGNEQRDQEVEA
ncbi:MAG: hypothetical protein PHS83_04425, partial [Clostridia bacterium]|nr:hypothetical protein [Clostridia bacterium]